MKSALLVGINDYPGTGSDLAGCCNDVADVGALLVDLFGFPRSNVSLLCDRRATRAAILKALAGLVHEATPGDTIVFHYSGHGSQVADTSGDEAGDRKDEILCPWDFDWGGVFIRDDDLAELFGELQKGVHLEVILDSCHSGTGTRELLAVSPRTTGRAAVGVGIAAPCPGHRQIQARYLPPPLVGRARAGAVAGGKSAVRRVGLLGRSVRIKHVLWAACRPEQYSADAELEGRPSGAFTGCFCRYLRGTGGRGTRAETLRGVRAMLRKAGFSQVPQLECPRNDRASGVFA